MAQKTNFDIAVKVSNSGLRAIGEYAVSIVVQRTLKGQDRFGRSFKGYSTRPLAVPAYFPGNSVPKRAIQAMVKEGNAAYFRTKKGALWILVKGGYAYLKSSVFSFAEKGSGNVNLSLTGAMLRGMTVVQVNDGIQSVTVGWTRAELGLRALWNIDRGRDFLGLTDEDRRNPAFVELIERNAVVSLVVK